MAFKNAMLSDTTTFNENGALSYTSTGDARVDFFTMIVRDSSNQDLIIPVLHRAWMKDPLDTLKLIFQKRDCRGGVGEKDVFYHSMIWLWTHHPKVFMHNIKHIPEYGSYKDWCKLVEFDHSVRYIIAAEFAKQLKLDHNQEGNSISLCAKYAPSEKKSFDKKIPGFVNIIARKFSPNHACNKDYRNCLSELRHKINIVEKQMCFNNWEDIDYSSVPSVALKKYANAFKKHNQEGYENWLTKVISGEAKLNASQLQPHEIAGKYFGDWGYLQATTEDELTEAQWGVMIDDTMGLGDFSKCVAMPDMSGSMSGLPMNVAATLSILIAKVAQRQESLFGNMVISFSEKPHFLQLDESDSLLANINILTNGETNGFSTDLYHAFSIMIDKAIQSDVSQEDFPEKLIILTDMQFDEVTGHVPQRLDMIDHIDGLFDTSPYNRPEIVCWNLRSTGNVVSTCDRPGLSLVSGFSKDTFKNIMNNEYTTTTPYDIMRYAIDDERYDRLTLP